MPRRIGKRWLPLAELLTVVLVGCGGGSNSSSTPQVAAEQTSTDLQASPPARMKSLEVGHSLVGQNPSSLQVTALSQASQTRIGRTVYEYVYQVTVVNNGSAIQGATLTLTIAGQGTTIVDGSASVGALAAGGTGTATDTITIRQDRLLAFDPNAFVWQVAITNPPPPPPPAEPVAGIDANGDGVRDDVEAYIKTSRGSAPAVRDALLQLAAGLQLAATASSATQRDAAEVARLNAGFCLADRTSPSQAESLTAEIQGKQLNTVERVRVETAFRDSLAGKTIALPSAFISGGTCK